MGCGSSVPPQDSVPGPSKSGEAAPSGPTAENASNASSSNNNSKVVRESDTLRTSKGIPILPLTELNVLRLQIKFVIEERARAAEKIKEEEPVSYTHLTLPTTPYV